ncbi:copper resistance protein CopC [Streptomyces stramineus]
MRSGIADGTYTVAWQAVSEDSHPVAGAFTFSIGAPSKTTAKVTTAKIDPTVDALYGTGRYAAYTGFVLLVGGCVFAGVCRSSRPVQRVAVGGWLTLFGSTVALLLLRGAYTSGRGPSAVFDLAVLGDVLATKPGAALLSRLLLLSAAAVFLAVLFGSYAREDDGRTRHERRDVAYGLGAARSSRPGWRPPGRWPSTPRPGSSRGWRCRSTCCTCWASRCGWADWPPCSRRCGRASRSGGPPSSASHGSRSRPCASWWPPGCTSPGGRSARGARSPGPSTGGCC